jgi:antitoxin MazE
LSTNIGKWGNSLGLRIPSWVAEQIHLNEGDEVTLSVEGSRLVITPVTRRKYTLSELLEGMSEDNLHSEVDWGEPMGREVW